MRGIFFGMAMVLAIGVAACGEEETTAPQEPAAEQAEAAAWTVLFDGRTLDNFDIVGDADWTIIENYVEATTGTRGFLVTKEAYGDFRLTLEFWTSAEANSGVFIRCQDVTNISSETCYEVNIFDQRPDPTYRTGAIVNVAEPLAEIDAADRWNTYEIIAEGPHLVVRLNGVLIADAEDDALTSGPIGIQWGAGVVRIRNVRITALD